MPLINRRIMSEKCESCVGLYYFDSRDKCFIPPNNSKGIQSVLLKAWRHQPRRKKKKENYNNCHPPHFLFLAVITWCSLTFVHFCLFLLKPSVHPLPLNYHYWFYDNILHSFWHPFKYRTLNICISYFLI